MTFVLDNSVTMRWCFGDGQKADLAYAETAMNALADGVALVPPTWSLEVVNVLTRAEHHGHIDVNHSTQFLSALNALRIQIDDACTDHALSDTLYLARRFRLSAYDAAYLELALRRDLPLATLDASLRKATKKAAARLFE